MNEPNRNELRDAILARRAAMMRSIEESLGEAVLEGQSLKTRTGIRAGVTTPLHPVICLSIAPPDPPRP